MPKTQSRTLPAVAAAFLAAGGVVYLVERPPGRQVTEEESDHTLRAEISTGNTALMVLLVESGWRGEIESVNTGVSKFHAVDVYVLEGEPITAVLLGEQAPSEQRTRITCRLLWDGRVVADSTAVVRTGDTKKTVTCRR